MVSYTTLSALLEICQNKSISGLLSAALSISKRLLPLGGTLFCGARTFLSEFQSNHSIFSDYQKPKEIKRVIEENQVRNFKYSLFFIINKTTTYVAIIKIIFITNISNILRGYNKSATTTSISFKINYSKTFSCCTNPRIST